MWRRASVFCIGLVSMGCATATTTTRPAVGVGRDVITAAEIVSSHVTDAYQAVLQLRPEFLRHRGATAVPSLTPPSVIVYLDDIEFGPAESLRNVPLGRVRTIRYLSPNEADLRWGRQHPSGAIHVVTTR